MHSHEGSPGAAGSGQASGGGGPLAALLGRRIVARSLELLSQQQTAFATTTAPISSWSLSAADATTATNVGHQQASSHATQSLQSDDLEQVSAELLLARRLFGQPRQAAESGRHLLLLFALLVLINLIVILGNILVILAVYATAKLRNVTNIFIVSLATADLLLGVFVLPYALMFEVSSSGGECSRAACFVLGVIRKETKWRPPH